MNPRTANPKPRTPFKLHQPYDHVRLVIRKTGRTVRSINILNMEEVKEPTDDLVIQWVLSCGTELIFQQGRDAEGKGSNCYRVTAINQNVKNGKSDTR